MCRYMWPSTTKPTILTIIIWVKATITNYNLWTTAPANLKPLACIFLGLYEPKCARIARTKILQQKQWNIARYVAHGSPYTRRLWTYVAPLMESMSEMVSKTLEREHQPAFRSKIMTRQAFLKIVSTQNQQKSGWLRFFCAAATLAGLQLWQRLRIMAAQRSYIHGPTSSSH